MKHLCFALSLVLLFSSCRKNLSSKDEVITAVVASDANSPLKAHSLTFTSNYPIKPAEVPPFSFTKTQYPDARVRTIRMLSRAWSIYPGYPKGAIELIGTFTYASNPGGKILDRPVAGIAPHLAYFKGTTEVLGYDNPGKPESVFKRNVNYQIFLSKEGYCLVIRDLDQQYDPLEISYYYEHPSIIANIVTREYSTSQIKIHDAIIDQYGNITGFRKTSDPQFQPQSWFTITYDYTKPRGSKNFSYIPSQNLVSQEFSLMEVMQWLPRETHQRAGASGVFIMENPQQTQITQSQIYRNFKFDVNGNQTSLTYGDNVLQRTSWHVQP
jgi:hypothetical protein